MSNNEIPSLHVIIDLITKKVKKTYFIDEIKQKIPFIPNEALLNLENATLTIKLRSTRIRQVLEDLSPMQKSLFFDDLLFFSMFQRFYSPFTSFILTNQYLQTIKQLQRLFSYSSKITNGIYLGIYQNTLSWGVVLSVTFSSILGSLTINPTIFGSIIPLIIQPNHDSIPHHLSPPRIISVNPSHKTIIEHVTELSELNKTWEQNPLIFPYVIQLLKLIEEQYLSTLDF